MSTKGAPAIRRRPNRQTTHAPLRADVECRLGEAQEVALMLPGDWATMYRRLRNDCAGISHDEALWAVRRAMDAERVR